MKIKLLSTILLFTLNLYLSAQQTFQWGVKAGGEGTDVVNDIATVDNDIYLTGRFSGSFTSGGETVEGKAMTDIYLMKLDRKGNTVWIRSLTGDGAGNGSRVTVGDDNIYLGGTLSGTVKQGKNEYSGEGQALFVASWSKQGKINWLTRLPFTGNATLDVLETAPDGSLLVGGLLQGTLKADGTELLTPGDKRAYTVTLSKEGKPIGAKLSAGEGSHRLVSAAFDTKNNQYLLFSISGNFGFGSDSIVTVPNSMKSGLVLQKTGESGNVAWMKTFESSGYIEGTKVLAGSGGEITVCANYNKTLKTGDLLYTTNSQLETMLFTFNSSGGQQWVKRITSPVKSRAMDVLYTRTGNLLLSGYFRQSCSVNDEHVYSEVPGGDLFLLQLGKAGETVWHDEPGQDAASFCKAFTLDQTGNIIFAGGFRGELALKNEKLSAAGKEDILVAKYFNCDQKEVKISGDNTLCSGGEVQFTATSGFYNYLWNGNDWGENTFTVNSPGIYTVTAFDKQGCAATDTFTVAGAESADLGLPSEIELFPGDKVTLVAGNGFSSYLWDDGTTSPEREVAYNPSVNNAELTLVAETFEGCPVTDTVQVKYIRDDNTIPGSNVFASAWPNPVHDKLEWFANTTEPSEISVILTDSKSVTVYSSAFDGYIPRSVKQIDMAGLASGNYLLSIKTGSLTYNLKIVKN
jgi:hypothetical protein